LPAIKRGGKMKLIITLTAVCDFPDSETTISDLQDGDSTIGEHITFKGHKIQPVIEFLEYQGKVEDTHTWGEPEEEIANNLYDALDSERYTIIELSTIEEKSGDEF
jgi:hypothetical protein